MHNSVAAAPSFNIFFFFPPATYWTFELTVKGSETQKKSQKKSYTKTDCKSLRLSLRNDEIKERMN